MLSKEPQARSNGDISAQITGKPIVHQSNYQYREFYNTTDLRRNSPKNSDLQPVKRDKTPMVKIPSGVKFLPPRVSKLVLPMS